MKLNKQFFLFCFILIIVSTLIKIICAPKINLSGFSGVIAVALFAGLKIKDKAQSFLLPLAALFVSDVLIQLLFVANLFPFAGFYSYQIYNYGLFFLITALGMLLRNFKAPGLAAGIIIGPLVFFLISNYIVWATNSGLGYNRNFSGLMECYRVALPFFRNSVISTAIFLPAFMALHQLMFNEKLVPETNNGF